MLTPYLRWATALIMLLTCLDSGVEENDQLADKAETAAHTESQVR